VKGDESFRYLEQFIDNIIALDPEFKRVYEWAVFAVTYRTGRATQEEFRMAAHYFELAIERFPDDWEFFWHGGLLYWFDLWSEDEKERNAFRERGAELIEQAMRKPRAPNSLATQAAALYSKLGKKERALAVLQEKLMTTDDNEAQEYMLRKFGSLAEDEDRANELRYATERFNALRNHTLANAPADLFVLMGPDPELVIRWDDLATARDLFGAGGAEPVELFPAFPRPALPPPVQAKAAGEDVGEDGNGDDEANDAAEPDDEGASGDAAR